MPAVADLNRVGQGSAVRRYMLLGTVFAVAGVAFSVFLVASGEGGGWALLVMIGCMYLAALLFLRNIGREQS
ncbi:hypothetical protein IQ279_09235 [Streptomyces verrucosisporus]|nr:hypothetical protein [Streptomyces verrucosisporus]